MFIFVQTVTIPNICSLNHHCSKQCALLQIRSLWSYDFKDLEVFRNVYMLKVCRSSEDSSSAPQIFHFLLHTCWATLFSYLRLTYIVLIFIIYLKKTNTFSMILIMPNKDVTGYWKFQWYIIVTSTFIFK